MVSLKMAEPALVHFMGIKALSMEGKAFTKCCLGKRKSLPCLRAAPLSWGCGAEEEVVAPLPPCWSSVFSCERGELAEDIFS